MDLVTARRAFRATRRRPAVLLDALSERAFQAHIVDYLKGHEFCVWTVPNMRLTAAGLPDLLFWHPARPGLLWAWELKREKRAVISPAQAVAIAHLSTVPGIDARVVKPSEWPALRDALEGSHERRHR